MFKVLKLFRRPLLTTLLVLVTVQARGAVYYVSPSGNDNNIGSEASPLQTIQYALEKAGGGTELNRDEIIVQAGTYITGRLIFPYDNIILTFEEGVSVRARSVYDPMDGNNSDDNNSFANVRSSLIYLNQRNNITIRGQQTELAMNPDEYPEAYPFDAASDVNIYNNSITIPDHNLITGDQAYYSTPSNPIGGLTDNTMYYAIRINSDTIRLAHTYQQAQQFNHIDLSNMSDGQHWINVQFRHTMKIHGCRNIILDGLLIKNSGGDGIYIGPSHSTYPYSQNITINNCVCDSHRRNGISVISVDGLYINNVTVKNNTGKHPGCGIDFEPNWNFERLNNISISNLQSINNRVGLQYHALKFDASSEPVSITVSDSSVYDCGKAFSVYEDDDNPETGSIMFEGIEIDNMSLFGAFIRKSAYGAQLTFKDCLFSNISRTLFILADNNETIAGGLTFDNIFFINEKSPDNCVISYSPTGYPYLKNISGTIYTSHNETYNLFDCLNSDITSFENINYDIIQGDISPLNKKPIAEAGNDQSLIDIDRDGYATVTLRGDLSIDPDGILISYQWINQQTNHLLSNEINPVLILPVGVHHIALTVADDHQLSATDTVTITVETPPNALPLANAGDDISVDDTDWDGVETVTLRGDGSTDIDGSITAYAWTNQDTGESLSSEPNLTITLPIGVHNIVLTVTDDQSESSSDAITITIDELDNRAPEADAGPGQTLIDTTPTNDMTVTLDASGSTDHDGHITQYQWLLAGKPIAAGITPDITLPLGEHTILLEVTDNGGLSATDTVTITIDPLTHSITTQPGPGGSILPAGPIDVVNGSDQTFTITPDADCYIVNVFIDGVAQGPAPAFTCRNVTSDQQVSAEFAPVEQLNGDATPPLVKKCIPNQSAIQAPVNSLIAFTLSDNGSGIDPNSVVIWVDDGRVYQDGRDKVTTEYGRCQRKGNEAEYIFTYQPVKNFNYDQRVTIKVTASDQSGNIMPEYTWHFTTQMHSFGGRVSVNSSPEIDMYAGSPVSVTAPDGTIWAAWHSGPEGDRDIFVARLLPGETSFEPEICLTRNTADQCHPSLAVADDGMLYIVWQDNRTGNWEIFLSYCPDNISWKTARMVTIHDANQTQPVLACDHADPHNIFVAWCDDRDGEEHIRMARSNILLETWHENRLSPAGQSCSEPVMAIDADNTLYAFWTADIAAADTDIHGAILQDDSLQHLNAVAKPGRQSQPTLALEPASDNIHLAWTDEEPGNLDIYYARASRDELPDSPLTGRSIIDDTTGAAQQHPVLCVRDYDNGAIRVFACWQDARNIIEENRDIDIYFAETGLTTADARMQSTDLFGANIWIPTHSDTTYTQTQPFMSLYHNDHPYIIWVNEQDNHNNIEFSGTTIIDNVLLAESIIPAVDGGIVGPTFDAIAGMGDVSVTVPAGAFWDDLDVTIYEVKNPPTTAYVTPEDIIGHYEFGPSSEMEFSQPVTIVIPFAAAEAGEKTVYWFNPDTGQFSQSGISNVELIEVSANVQALRYTTTHFSQYVVARTLNSQSDPQAASTVAGGCSMNRYHPSSDNPLEFLLPYLLLTLYLTACKLHRSRHNPSREFYSRSD